MVLRQYQKETLESLQGHLAFDDKAVIPLPGGGGKSAIAAELARIADEENSHLVILTNMTALIPQLARHLDEFNVEYNVIKAGYDKIWNPNAKITLIMEQSFHEKRRLKNDVKCDILIKDEMHIGIGQKRYEDIVRHLNPDKTIGMTFTPINESGYLMHGIKTENIVTTVSVKDLIGLGYLVPTKVFVPQWAEKIEYEGVNTSGADFNGKEIDKIVNEDEHISLTIQSMNQMDAKNKKTLVYASSIGHADALLLALTEQGYATALVHSEMPSDHNAEEISRFKDEWAEQADLFDGTKNQRKVDCLISVMALSVGFDSPQARLLVLLRPTKVLRLYLQIAARVARPAEGKEYAELLDLAQCTRRLGFSDEPIKYVEQGNKKELTEEKEDREATVIRLLAGDEPTEITRDVVVTKLKELKQKSQNVSTMTVSDLTALYDTSNSIDLILNIAYEMNLRKYGLSYSKKDVMTVATHWHSMIEEFPEHRNRLLKTLRTMSKRKVSENKKLFALFYVARKPDGWLWTLPPYVYALQDEFQTKEEEEEAYEYYKGYEIEIDEEEIPF